MKISYMWLLLMLMSCVQEKSKTTKTNQAATDETKVIVTKHENGKVRAEIPYKNGKQNGLSRSYDRQGKLILELPYVNGKRDGVSKKFYAGGKQLYQTTTYKDDKMHGKQTKYREDGKLMSEAKYENNLPCMGLKEYLLDGSLKKQYPKINIAAVDQLEDRALYTLEISMSDKVRSVKYYKGKLSQEGCITDDLYNIYFDENRNIAVLKYHMPPGSFIMEEVNIIAVVETILGNTYVTQRSYNVAIDN